MLWRNFNRYVSKIAFFSHGVVLQQKRFLVSGISAATRSLRNPMYPLFPPLSKLIIRRSVTSLGKTQGRLLILGSGWAGFKLLKDMPTKFYELVVISPRNYFVFTPLLASTSVGTLEFRCITEPVRKFSPKVLYYQAYADTIDFDKQLVYCTSNLEDKRDKFTVPYDTLVIAVGANSNTFGIPGVGEHALFLKDISDARKIRSRVIECFEHASQPDVSEEDQLGLLQFAVIGGGPTGIEFSAELYDFISEDLTKLYPLLMTKVRLAVYDIAPQILGSFDVGLRDYATKKFTRKGISIRTGRTVLEVKKTHLVIKEDGEVPYGMVVWATGLTDNPLTRSIGDRIIKDQSAKRLLTDPRLRILKKDTGLPMANVYAIGDCATIKDNDLPATAQVANQKAMYLRKVLDDLSRDPNADVKPFVFHNLGVMAYIGKKEALVDLTKVVSPKAKESGVLAWLLWRSVYFSYTVSLRNKLLIPMYWFLTFFFGRDITRF